MSFHVPEQYRWIVQPTHLYYSNASYGNNGVFFIPHIERQESQSLRVIASDGDGWEHCSVSLPHRCPIWAEMCAIKRMFWDPEDTVIQFHPPESQYVNCHPYTLHLWRPIGVGIPLPPRIMV